MVEQGTHKPLVGGSNPPSATTTRHTSTRRRFPPARRGRFDFLTFPAVAIRSAAIVRRDDRGHDLGQGVWRALDGILATRGGARRRSLHPEAPSLNPKFFRNGIVMLVLVVGTAALLFTWITTTGQPTNTGYSQFLAEVSDGQDRQGHPAGHDADRRTHRYTTDDLHGHRPHRPDPGLPDMLAAAKTTGKTLPRRHLPGDPRAGHVVAGPAAHRRPAAADHRRLHLLHDAPGAGHQ